MPLWWTQEQLKVHEFLKFQQEEKERQKRIEKQERYEIQRQQELDAEVSNHTTVKLSEVARALKCRTNFANHLYLRLRNTLSGVQKEAGTGASQQERTLQTSAGAAYPADGGEEAEQGYSSAQDIRQRPMQNATVTALAPLAMTYQSKTKYTLHHLL